MNSIIIVKKNKKLIYKYYKIKINLQTEYHLSILYINIFELP